MGDGGVLARLPEDLGLLCALAAASGAAGPRARPRHMAVFPLVAVSLTRTRVRLGEGPTLPEHDLVVTDCPS